MGMIEASFKILFLLWVPEPVRFYMHPLGVKSVFPTALELS